MIEGAGISTVAIVLKPELAVGVGMPRAVFVRFPLGNPVGEPFKPDQQRQILRTALEAATQIERRGVVLELPYKWRRM